MIAMSHRSEQLISTLHRAVQNVITRGLNDPRISGLVSVTKIELAQDKRTATVFVSVMPGDRSALVLHGLNSAAEHIRTKVGDAVSMRRVPTLTFELDDSIKKQVELLAAIQRGLDETDSDQSATDASDSSVQPDHAGGQGSAPHDSSNPLTDQGSAR